MLQTDYNHSSSLSNVKGLFSGNHHPQRRTRTSTFFHIHGEGNTFFGESWCRWRPAIMEPSHGFSVSLRLVSRWTKRLWSWLNSPGDIITEEQIENELWGLVMDGRELNITFEEFPSFLSEQTRVLLTSAAHFRLKHYDFSKHTLNLSPASKAILLSGPSELYLQKLAKALAHFFEAKLLVLDVNDFSRKLVNKYGCSKKESSSKRSTSRFPGSFSTLSQREETKGTVSMQRRGASAKSRCANPLQHCGDASTFQCTTTSSQCTTTRSAHFKCRSNWAFDEKLLLQSLYKVLVSVSETHSIILYIRDVEKLLQSDRIFKLFHKMLDKLSAHVLILGSRLWDLDDEGEEMDEWVTLLFPYKIEIQEPDDETHLVIWDTQLEEEKKMFQFQENKNHIAEVLATNDLDCDDLGSICSADSKTLSDHIEEIVISALSYHLMNNKDPEYRNRKLVISSESLSHGLGIFQEDTQKPSSEIFKQDVPQIDNEFERRIRSEVIKANQIGVTFNDVGALNDVKESLQELVMLPLQRPELFTGGLLKPCRGILLYGPPGTGKTMLAKAIANEARASFINVSMSTITSKLFGEVEKNVRALFTLASKVSPTIIFVDEVDSMLGQRTRAGEHEAMRKIKNEFMTHWDGLATEASKRILILAATNRPFDLDEAIIRRFERRMMVGLPSVESREMILKTLLAKEKTKCLDFNELATMTDGYTGSDIKNLCMAAAYRPVRELLQEERLMKDKKKKQDDYEGQSSEDVSDSEEETREKVVRPLNMEDMRQAKNQVAASCATEGALMDELKQWNELYGEGGSRIRKTQQLTYFL